MSYALDGSEIVSFRDVVPNGTVPNGFRWNGFRWNGFRWNGFRWNGFRWNGCRFNGNTVTDVVLDDNNGTLEATDDQSNAVALAAGDEFVAEGDHDDSGTVTETETKVSEIEEVTASGHSYQFQRVQTRVLESAPDNWGAWEDACLDGGGNPTKAVLLKGDWSKPTYARDTTTGVDEATTWACRGAALGKCVEWGYHPEASESGTPLEDHHQACTRLVRADYCGNGDHHTENGTLLDVEDSLGIQTHATSWDIEAFWGVDGALCINETRKTYWDRTEASIGCNLPRCDSQTDQYWWNQGALLATRNQPSALVDSPPAPSDSGG